MYEDLSLYINGQFLKGELLPISLGHPAVAYQFAQSPFVQRRPSRAGAAHPALQHGRAGVRRLRLRAAPAQVVDELGLAHPGHAGDRDGREAVPEDPAHPLATSAHAASRWACASSVTSSNTTT